MTCSSIKAWWCFFQFLVFSGRCPVAICILHMRITLAKGISLAKVIVPSQIADGHSIMEARKPSRSEHQIHSRFASILAVVRQCASLMCSLFAICQCGCSSTNDGIQHLVHHIKTATFYTTDVERHIHGADTIIRMQWVQLDRHKQLPLRCWDLITTSVVDDWFMILQKCDITRPHGCKINWIPNEV